MEIQCQNKVLLVTSTINKRSLSNELQHVKRTCSGIIIMKIFLSLSDSTCLIKKYPVPIKTMTVNNKAPFNLTWIKNKIFTDRSKYGQIQD